MIEAIAEACGFYDIVKRKPIQSPPHGTSVPAGGNSGSVPRFMEGPASAPVMWAKLDRDAPGQV